MVCAGHNSKSQYNVAKVLLTGLVFHLVFIGSVYDCYFTNPVVDGMNRYGRAEEGQAPARRLVLIVGDGLRADLLFTANGFKSIVDSPEHVAPYLRSIVETKGAFGISHTRVPTETRPGHVAIIGGMYEDISAVTKGWKASPIDFDSVFNQSRETFSFGSPDVLPIFAEGASPGKVKTWSYGVSEEDYTKDATFMDTWVLDQLKTLFNNATDDPGLDRRLRDDKVVFFLHLQGLDTTGHSYRPFSKEYMHNIQLIDEIVRQTENLVHAFYQDDRTSFIFTADHGMSTVGNHGDGHPDSTRTPLIAWGSGIRGPLPDEEFMTHDNYSRPWQLDSLFRRDVEQADIAPLLATLIGIDWPSNSVGVLPDTDPTQPGFLDISSADLARAALINAKVVLEQYRVKHELKNGQSFFYTPYAPLAGVVKTESEPQITAIKKLIAEGRWDDSRHLSLQLIQESLKGLNYLQTYDHILIRSLVILAYAGWAAYASLFVFRPLDRILISPKSLLNTSITIASWFLIMGFWIFFTLQKSPRSYYYYSFFPCYFWKQFLAHIVPYIQAQRRDALSGYHIRAFATCALITMAMLLGMSVGYAYRPIWSIGMLFLGTVWPCFWKKEVYLENASFRAFWAASCLSTAVFPMLSVDKDESLLMIMAGGLAVLATGYFGAVHVLRSVEPKGRLSITILFVVQGMLVVATMLVTASSVLNLQAKEGLPILNQKCGWVLLGASSLLPLVYKSSAHTRHSKALTYLLGFGSCFVILSISVECLFFVSYSITLMTWAQAEKLLHSSAEIAQKYTVDSANGVAMKEHSRDDVLPRNIKMDDLRIAVYFLFFVQLGFVGAGNFASISSFYLAPVFRLIAVYNPFYTANLLMFKIIAPYIMLSVILALLTKSINLRPFSLLVIGLTLTDGMTLAFFLNVRHTGSWFKIDQSISFFCVSSLLLLWSTVICAAGELLMSDVLSARLTPSSPKSE